MPERVLQPAVGELFETIRRERRAERVAAEPLEARTIRWSDDRADVEVEARPVSAGSGLGAIVGDLPTDRDSEIAYSRLGTRRAASIRAATRDVAVWNAEVEGVDRVGAEKATRDGELSQLRKELDVLKKRLAELERELARLKTGG